MSARTGIEWTDATWNPVVGCTQVSPGCAHCYAKQLHDMRHKAVLGGKTLAPQYAVPFETVQLMPDRLTAPLSWREPRRIFVNSVSDLFHDDVPASFIAEVWAVMALAPRHTFQILTKRPARMRDVLTHPEFYGLVLDAANRHRRSRGLLTMIPVSNPSLHDGAFYPHVWLGVSVENQRFADERIPLLLQTPAAVRFLSCEPLLGPVHLPLDVHTSWCPICKAVVDDSINLPHENIHLISFDAPFDPAKNCTALESLLHWVIVGGESGKGARAMHPDWARSIRNQCESAGVAFFFKQWGEHAEHAMEAGGDLGGDMRRGIVQLLHGPDGIPGHFRRGDVYMRRVGTKRAGRILDSRTWDEFPVASS